MGLLKFVILGLFVTCITAQSAKTKPQTIVKSSIDTKDTIQKRNDAVKIEYIPIYLYSRENSLDGDYNYRYETANGIYAEERGEILNKGTKNQANSVVGSYRYTSPDGTPVEVTYTAGVDGFRAYGTHLPTPSASAALDKSLSLKGNAPSALFSRTQLRSIDSVPVSHPVTLEKQQELEKVNNVGQQQNTFVVTEDRREVVKPEQVRETEPEYQQQVILDDRSSVEQQKPIDVSSTKITKEFYPTVSADDIGLREKSNRYQLVQEVPVLQPKGYSEVETELSKKQQTQVVLQDVVSDQKVEPFGTSQTYIVGQQQVVLKGPVSPLSQEVVQDAVKSEINKKFEPYRSSQHFNVEQPQAVLTEPVNPLTPAVVQDVIKSQSDQKLDSLRSVQPIIVNKPNVVPEQSQLTSVVPVLRPSSIQGVVAQPNLVPVLQRVSSIVDQQQSSKVSPNLVGVQRSVLYNQPRSNSFVGQINVEPQLLWLLQPNQGRFLPYPVVPRTLEPPRYFIIIAFVAYIVAKTQGYESKAYSGYGTSTTPSLSAASYQKNSVSYPKSLSSYPTYSTGTSSAYKSSVRQNQLSYLAPSAPVFIQQSGIQSGYQPAVLFGYPSNIQSNYQPGYQSGISAYQPTAVPPSYLKNSQFVYQSNVSPAIIHKFGGSSLQSTPVVSSFKKNSKLNYQSTLSPYNSKSSTSAALLNPSFTSPQYQSQHFQQSGQRNLQKPSSSSFLYQKPISNTELLKASSDSSDLYKPAENGFNAFAPGNIAGPEEVTPILSQNSQQNLGDGSYSYSYETGNGISASEYGQLKPGGPEGIQSVYGSYSYPGEDGKIITITYTADENGFVAKGDHLPTSPPIPAEILQSLEQNAAEEAAQQQSSYGQNGSSAPYSQESEVYNQAPNTGSYGQISASRAYGQTSNINAHRQNPFSGSYNQPTINAHYFQSSTSAPRTSIY
ncbi:uncharacterized protein LOC126910561 [Daktulosphaira vitifoliae]|uniref:uncharacterized protein LOC126910561 n=1 Tax=Daktulosphaira vitifoliae TaxID=58002 RepID=UPI0021AAC656|nr:uncharacterized protein LOC126910561 [Daktulosphaira vitifoliae]